MAEVSLLDGAAANFTWLVDNSNSYELGARFTPAVDCQATALRWYAVDTTRPAGPARLNLWDATTGVRIATVATPADNGSGGWQRSDLPAPVQLTAGREYRASGHFPVGTRRAFWNSGNAFTLPDGVSVPRSAIRCIATSAASTYPTTPVDAAVESTDVILELTPPASGGGASTGDIENALVRWFASTGDNLRQTQLPWATKAVLDTFRSAYDGTTGALTDTANAAGSVLAREAQILADTAALIARVPATIGQSLSDTLSWLGTGGRPSGQPTIPDQIAALPDQSYQGAQTALLREWLTLSPDLADPARWSVVGTAEGTGPDAVALQADLYVLHITATGEARSTLTIGSYVWRRYLGWVAPTVHGAALPRRQLEWDTNAICHPPLLMDGLLIHTGPDVEWLVVAYVLDRA